MMPSVASGSDQKLAATTCTAAPTLRFADFTLSFDPSALPCPGSLGAPKWCVYTKVCILQTHVTDLNWLVTSTDQLFSSVHLRRCSLLEHLNIGASVMPPAYQFGLAEPMATALNKCLKNLKYVSSVLVLHVLVCPRVCGCYRCYQALAIVRRIAYVLQYMY